MNGEWVDVAAETRLLERHLCPFGTQSPKCVRQATGAVFQGMESSFFGGAGVTTFDITKTNERRSE